MSDRRSYPPGHPATPPPDATAVACFRTAADAVAAGYPEAPLPAGAVEVGGVYLTPTSPALRARCRRAAGRLGFAVPCPGLLPNSAPHTGPPRLCDTPQFGCARGQPFVLRQDGFQVPPGYLVTGSQPLFGGSLTIMAWPGSRLPAGADPESCAAPGRPVDVRQVAGARALLARCPEGSPLADVGVFESQTLLAWSRSGRYTIVGVGGWSTVNEGLAVAVAEHLEPVEPGR